MSPPTASLLACTLALLNLVVSASAEIALQEGHQAADPWAYLDNGTIRLGVKKSSGAAIGYFSASDSKQNLLDHWDHGRLVQQSYYGKPDGTLWNKQPWRWNPVQGGDWRGEPSNILELKVDKAELYAKTQGIHWASGEHLPDVTLEQWITLDGPVAHVRFRMTYTGNETHPPHHQEIPAFFVEPHLNTLVLYDGRKPWTQDAALHRSKPGWPNETRKPTENWAAYVNADDFGVGAYVPVASELTCYRFGANEDAKGACSYFAPLTTFAVKPGLIFEYDLYITCGKSTEIRERFAKIHARRNAENKP